MIEKIISGGQTGVDQAGLLIATEIGIPVGGWCPKGGLDENGKCILDLYPHLKETSTSNPDERTKLNIMDSDGTIIVVPNWPLTEKIKDGTILTCQYAKEKNKPFFIIDLQRDTNIKELTEILSSWIEKNNIYTLNIAGPRESNSPNIYDKSCVLLRSFFCHFSKKNNFNF